MFSDTGYNITKYVHNKNFIIKIDRTEIQKEFRDKRKQGIQLKGTLLAKDYMMSIRGGHNISYKYNYEVIKKHYEAINKSIIAFFHIPNKYKQYLDTGLDNLQIYE